MLLRAAADLTAARLVLVHEGSYSAIHSGFVDSPCWRLLRDGGRPPPSIRSWRR